MTADEEGDGQDNQEFVFFMDREKRTAKKNYLNVKAVRMIAKAKDNIHAVGKGRFPLPTPTHLVKGNPKII
jgi:hypothetical protein